MSISAPHRSGLDSLRVRRLAGVAVKPLPQAWCWVRETILLDAGVQLLLATSLVVLAARGMPGTGSASDHSPPPPSRPAEIARKCLALDLAARSRLERLGLISPDLVDPAIPQPSPESPRYGLLKSRLNPTISEPASMPVPVIRTDRNR